MLIIPVILIGVVTWMIAARQNAEFATSRVRGSGLDPAIEVVRQRYARGELTQDQFERLVAGLLGHRSARTR